jgi:hypothetical protein
MLKSLPYTLHGTIYNKFVLIIINQQLITIMNKSELIDAIAADAGITKLLQN